MKKKLLVILASMAMMLTFAPAVSAGTQGSCTPTTGASIRFYENKKGDTGDNNDSFWIVCNKTLIGSQWKIADLAGYSHSLPGDCASLVGGRSTWNDCVSSIKVWLPSTFYEISLYNCASYNCYSERVDGPWTAYRLDLTINDALSSLIITAD